MVESVSYTHLRVSSLYPRFREMMESNDYTGLDECLAGMDALDDLCVFRRCSGQGGGGDAGEYKD